MSLARSATRINRKLSDLKDRKVWIKKFTSFLELIANVVLTKNLRMNAGCDLGKTLGNGDRTLNASACKARKYRAFDVPECCLCTIDLNPQAGCDQQNSFARQHGRNWLDLRRMLRHCEWRRHLVINIKSNKFAHRNLLKVPETKRFSDDLTSPF
jgi:hypothetical protein